MKLTAAIKNNTCQLTAKVKAAPPQKAKVRFERKVGSAWKKFSMKKVGQGASTVKVPCAKQAGSKVRAALLQGTKVLGRSKIVTQPIPDTTAPVITIVVGPEGPTNEASPVFTFGADEPATFACRLYPASQSAPTFAPCSGPSTQHTPPEPLADDTYVFEVRATDAAKNAGTATRTFTVDTTPPETTITSGPDPEGAVSPVTFVYESSEEGSSFVCATILGIQLFPCLAGSSMVHYFQVGPQTFRVAAVDAAGNQDPTPAEHFFILLGPQR